MAINIAASLRDRLKAIAKKRQRPFNEVLQYYAMERLLYRVGISSHRDHFVLKGALMMVVWNAPGARPTKDIDFLGYSRNSLDVLEEIFVEICTTDAVGDGIEFDADTIETRRIKENADYEGVRLIVRGRLGTARLTVQVDVGFGDSVYPAAQEIDFPTLLDLPAPILRGYPRETVVAEKINAMVSLELYNSRMKDFYDLWLLSTQFEFNSSVLKEAIKKTFEQRNTRLPTRVPVALTSIFWQDANKMAQWTALRRRLTDIAVPDLAEVVQQLYSFLVPVLLDNSYQTWPAGGPWRSRLTV